jgi:uncharacterized OB-fold protein
VSEPRRANHLHSALVERGADGSITLVGGYSPASGRHHFPLAELCPYSGAADVERVLLPTTGGLWLWTAVTSAPPGYDGPVPYGLGIVVLDGVDLRVAGRLTVAEPGALAEGEPMRVVPDLDVWAWAPA